MRPTPLHLVLLAGGRGLRAGGGDGEPKQFRRTARGPLYTVSLRTFLDERPDAPWHLASLTITAPEERHAPVAREVAAVLADRRRGRPALPFQLAAPGATRTASTWHALRELDTRL